MNARLTGSVAAALLLTGGGTASLAHVDFSGVGSIDPESGRIYLVAADLDPTAPAPTSGRNMKIVPGSFRLMFLDPR